MYVSFLLSEVRTYAMVEVKEREKERGRECLAMVCEKRSAKRAQDLERHSWRKKVTILVTFSLSPLA